MLMERNCMKTPPGLLFLVALLVLLAAALVGGQVWAITGSTPLGAAAGLAVGAVLGVLARPVLRRLTPGRRQFLGEYRGTVDDGEFAAVADVLVDGTTRGKIKHGVDERPERVAESVRSLLSHGPRRQGSRR